MAIKFRLPNSPSGKNVRYIYFGSNDVIPQKLRVGMVVFRYGSLIYYPYRLAIPIVNNVDYGSIDQTEFLYGKYGDTGLEVKITPSAGRQVPTNIEASNCTGSYTAYPNLGYGIYTIRATNAGAESVTLTGSCPVAGQLDAPSLSVSGNTLSITDNDTRATNFDLYVNDQYATNIPKTS